MTIPENTSDRDPMIHLLGMMSDGSSDYITDMEAAGQRQLVHSDKLPTDRSGDFDALGFTFGDVVDGDPMFQAATLPDGWSREPTDHSMWSRIVDERGIERVSIFYKAAFYDRSAHAVVVNVGGALASHFIFSDEPDISSLDKFTDEERADFVGRLRSETEHDRTSTYGDLDRARRWLADNEVTA